MPERLNYVSYLGAGSSGVGASGFGIAERKGYVYSWYNANEEDGEQYFLTGAEYACAYERSSDADGASCASFGLGFGDGKVSRQVRDIEMYSYELTSSDLDEFLDLASMHPKILPAEAKIGGKFGSYPEVPEGKEREKMIEDYLNNRYGSN